MQWIEIILEDEGYNLLEEIRMKCWVEELQIRASSRQLTLKSVENNGYLFFLSLSLSLSLYTSLSLRLVKWLKIV